MKLPALLIYEDKILNNAEVVSSLLRQQGLTMVGVAKGLLAHPAVVRAMIKGGARAIGDSRIENLKRLRENGYQGETVLLRAPSLSRVSEVVCYADTSLNSDPVTVRALGKAAFCIGKVHKVILMVDLGDLREGVLAGDAEEAARQMTGIPGIYLEGIGTNMSCYGGVMPTRDKMEELLRVKARIEGSLGISLVTVSGGNSANIGSVLAGEMPPGITELRIGEGVILGREAIQRLPIPGCCQDALVIRAEVIEVLEKPSKPWGRIGQDAFGKIPVFDDCGIRRRAILALGRQDVDPEGIRPVDKGVRVIGASSDHLICDVEDAERSLTVGSNLDFLPNYSALLLASTSPFVEKVVQ